MQSVELKFKSNYNHLLLQCQCNFRYWTCSDDWFSIFLSFYKKFLKQLFVTVNICVIFFPFLLPHLVHFAHTRKDDYILDYNRGKWEVMKKLKIILINIESVQVFFIFKKNEPNLQLRGLQIFCEINLLLSVVHSKYKCTLRWVVSVFLSIKTHDAWSCQKDWIFDLFHFAFACQSSDVKQHSGVAVTCSVVSCVNFSLCHTFSFVT